MRVLAEPDPHVEAVAARDAAGRMHDYRMADGLAFRVERALHAQRAVVQPVREGRARAVPLETEFEAGAPRLLGGGGSGRGVGIVGGHRRNRDKRRAHATGCAAVRHEGFARRVARGVSSRARTAYGDKRGNTAQTAISSRTPCASISRPAPPATISPRLITQ